MSEILSTEAPTIAELYAQRGAELLDQRYPGWQNKINTLNLDMATTDRCILGQLFGDYHVGTLTLNLAWGEVVEFGFDTDGFEGDPTFDELTAAWEDVVTRWQGDRMADPAE